MANPSETSAKKVATLMFSDIAGFSKKLAENEARAFDLLKTHDALIRVLTAKFDGKVVKSYGDSFIVEFPSPVHAVKCAIEIQKRLWTFNRGKTEAQTIRVRIGIHIGEISVNRDEIKGEGVTVVSRIEALTEPNRISMTQDALDQTKEKLTVHTFKVGPVEITDIGRPIDVYEVLIDSIPELSHPSQTAQQTAASQQTAFAATREVEEVHEAKRIEDTKRRLLNYQAKTDDDRKRKIAAHYARAETFFEAGKLDEAEAELAEVAKLDQHPSKEQKRQGEETGRVVQDHLTKARGFITAGNLDAAEEELNEIFRTSPLNVGAQQMLLQIEEERYHLEESKRSQQSRGAAKQLSEEERKIGELLQQARALLQEEKFKEAIFVLHDLFLVDPNHSGARHLEESIRQAEQTKAEFLRIQTEQAQEEQQLKKLVVLQQRVEERRQRQIKTAQQVDYQSWYKKIGGGTAAIIILVLAYFALPRIMDLLFPKSATIAVVRFTNAPNESTDLDLFTALPALLTEDFGQCEHMTVIAPTTALQVPPDAEHLQLLAAQVPVDYLLTGTIAENHGHYTIDLRLVTANPKNSVYVGAVEGTLPILNTMRASIVEKVLETIGVKSSAPHIIQPYNPQAFVDYLKGLRLLYSASRASIDSAKTVLRSAIKVDPSFGLAYGTLAEAMLRSYNAVGDSADLQSAADCAQRALQNSPEDARAHQILATYDRLTRHYDAALSSINESLASLPQNQACYRELAFLAIAARKFDDAESYAANAVLYDPQNPESFFTLGLAQQMKKEYPAAEKSFGKAIALGKDYSAVTRDYLQQVWASGGKYDSAANWCQRMIQSSPTDYRSYYLLGRVYQLSLQITTAQQWLEKGLAVVHKILDTNPNDAAAHAYAGLISSRLGKFSEGEAEMSTAFRLDSTSAEILFRRANLYSIQRNKQKALDSFDDALQRQYSLVELCNPDISFIESEPEFASLAAEPVEGTWPKK